MLTYQPTQLFTRSLARVLTYQSTHSFVSSIAQLLFDVLARYLDCLPDSFARLSPGYLLACSSLTWLARLLTGLPSCVLAHSLNYFYFVSRLLAYLLSFGFLYLIAGAHARPLGRLLAHLPTKSDSYLHGRVTWFLYPLACSLARRPSNLRLLGAAHDHRLPEYIELRHNEAWPGCIPEPWCLLCKKWADHGHIISKMHRRRLSWS